MTRRTLCNNSMGHSLGTKRTLLLAVGVVVVAFALITVVHGEDCGQEEFTKCAEPLEMLHLTSEFSIGAAKKEELDKLCHELRKGIRCIQSYTRRCMDLQQRNQFNKLYHGTNQFIRDLCNKGEFQDEYLKHAPCSEMAKKEFEVCANRYKETMVFLKPTKNHQPQQQPPPALTPSVSGHAPAVVAASAGGGAPHPPQPPQPPQFHHETASGAGGGHAQEVAAENDTWNENIKTICCSISELVDCSEDAARKICGNDAAKFTRELVDKYAYSLTKLYCENFTRHPEICRDGEAGSSRGNVPRLWLTVMMALGIVEFARWTTR